MIKEKNVFINAPGKFWRKPSFSVVKIGKKAYIVRKVYHIGSKKGVIMGKKTNSIIQAILFKTII